MAGFGGERRGVCDGGARSSWEARRTLKAVLIVGIATVLMASSNAGAAPTFSDWSAPVNLGPVVNSAILEQVNRINALTSAMLEMSRLQKKTLTLDFEEINLAMLAKEVVSELEREIQTKNHTVTVLFGNELPIVQADRLRAHDVIENLIDQAVLDIDPS